jgi:hypothetical protein
VGDDRPSDVRDGERQPDTCFSKQPRSDPRDREPDDAKRQHGNRCCSERLPGTAETTLVAIDDVQTISAEDEGGVLRLRLTQPFLALELADHGAVFREATADPTTTTLVIDIPDSIDVRTITQLVRETFSTVELRAKQTLDQTAAHDLYSRFLDKLTDRQLEVIQTAYYSGYFESPRENTGEDGSATLGISPPAFYTHARTVQRKLFATLFEENNPPSLLRLKRFSNKQRILELRV